MFVSAFLMVSLAIALCLIATRATLSFLGLSTMQVLLYLGIAHVPAPPVSRRRRP